MFGCFSRASTLTYKQIIMTGQRQFRSICRWNVTSILNLTLIFKRVEVVGSLTSRPSSSSGKGGGGDGVSGQLPIRLKIRLHPKATVHVCRQNRKALHFHISLDISTQKIRLYLLLSINSFHLHAFVRLLKLPLFSTLPVPWVTSTRDRRALI